MNERDDTMTMIRRLLIANRGEIAVRIARTCRRLGIETVAVFSDADADALHVRSCDQAVRLPGSTAADTYLRADLLLDAARRTGADAVHPGYGFLAESSDFAAAVTAAGLVWIGPSPDAIAAMGSKIASKALMAASGVPVLPEGPDAGFPLLVKASAGGGGRGMRVVRDPADLDDAIAAASREAEAAFGDGEVFCERFIERGRHVEVQVFGDTHGTVVALYERECSVQRRHQKIIEEAPSPVVDDELRAAMGSAAVAAARAVGYVGAGTVEFLLDDDGHFHFLEMNTRLQVEHPVTEAITGLDLVELQIRVAEGEPLPPGAIDAPRRGHAIEARLTAEDPAAGYAPAIGRFVQFDVSHGPEVRVDTGVETGATISPYYDSMVAKVIAHAPTRAGAIRALRTALAVARLDGVVTNRDQLVNILDSVDFVAGECHTDFLSADAHAEPRPGDWDSMAAALWFREEATIAARPGVPAGWRNNRAVPRTRTVTVDGTEVVLSESSLGARLAAPVTFDDTGTATVVLDRDGRRLTYSVAADGPLRYLTGPDGARTVEMTPRHPEPQAAGRAGSLVATMPGVIRQLLVQPGDTVTAGQAVAVIEAMKMEHQLTAPADGTVTAVLVGVGDQVDSGASLLQVE